MTYYALKHLHITFVAVSGILFLVRGLWMLSGSAHRHARPMRIAPHVIDTLLLASAIGLVAWSGQYPWQTPWLGAKLLALVVYIGLGTVALKRGPTLRIRALAFAAALSCFGYIVAVALTRHPLIVA